jgi:hypothetical protein
VVVTGFKELVELEPASVRITWQRKTQDNLYSRLNVAQNQLDFAELGEFSPASSLKDFNLQPRRALCALLSPEVPWRE